jgi:hypothetical protein
MTLCVAGMHRSGTSMVMSLLARLGLDVGDQQDLIPANDSNLDGHWENIHFVDLDDALLGVMGGGWDYPPARDLAAGDAVMVRELTCRARKLRGELGLRDPWGWKDPRASLLLPFWFDVFPELRVVVCVRNPLDVALSLRSRGYSSYALGLSLWKSYNERILSGSSPGQRLITHYSAYFDRTESELRRVCAFAGLTPTDDQIDGAIRSVKPGHRHNTSGMQELIAADVPRDIIDLYQQLCEESEWCEPASRRHGSAAGGPGGTSPERSTSANALLLELGSVRRQICALQSVVEDRDNALKAAEAAIAQRNVSEQVTRDEVLALQVAQLHAAMTDQIRCSHSEQAARDEALALQVAQLHAAMSDQIRWSNSVSAQLGVLVAEFAHQAHYRRVVQRIRQVVDQVLPVGSAIAVISRGDDDLVEFHDRRGLHFPQDAQGRYAGYHPRDSAEALTELSRIAGDADFLLIPAPAFWWLKEYREFGEHLYRNGSAIHEDDTCVIFTLEGEAARGLTGRTGGCFKEEKDAERVR